MPSLSHDCQRCGASCQGLRARVAVEERDPIAELARTLGIERPFDGDHLRQNWGRCVFHDKGCQLHRLYGATSKPAVCQRFPRLGAAIDPGCFHPGPAIGDAATVNWDSLEDGVHAAEWLQALALPALLDGPILGPEVARRLVPMIGAVPTQVPKTARPQLAIRFATVRDYALVPQLHPVRAAHGGAQLLAGADALTAFPAWIRLLKLGLFGCRT